MPSQFMRRKNAEKEQKSIKKELTSEAIDVIFNKDTKNYELVTVMYNLETKEAEVKEITVVADSKHMITYKLKEIITKKIFKEG